jgi:hypothetical protein
MAIPRLLDHCCRATGLEEQHLLCFTGSRPGQKQKMKIVSLVNEQEARRVSDNPRTQLA